MRQMSNVNINASCVGCGNAGRLLFVQYGTVNGDINESDPFGGMRYDALQSQLTRRLGSVQMGASYTYSRAMDMADNSTLNGLTFAYPAYWARNWAAAGYDRTHNFEFWGVYPLPFGKGQKMLQHGAGAWILGGWQANAVFTAASGTPFTVQASNNLLNAPGNTETANQVSPAVQIFGNFGPGQSWFNPAAYANPAQNTYGNTGRNSLRGPGYFELDGSLFSRFQSDREIEAATSGGSIRRHKLADFRQSECESFNHRNLWSGHEPGGFGQRRDERRRLSDHSSWDAAVVLDCRDAIGRADALRSSK